MVEPLMNEKHMHKSNWIIYHLDNFSFYATPKKILKQNPSQVNPMTWKPPGGKWFPFRDKNDYIVYKYIFWLLDISYAA